MFLPINKKDLKKSNKDQCDIIIVTGDAYVDHPSFGAAIICRYLESKGYTVGIIAQPNWNSDADFLKLGMPRLFVGITAGNIDSMLAHYTANKKIRSDDAYTPGNIHGKRPNRATIVYTNKIKQLMPNIPVVIGGLEASLRRFAHYDYWSDKVRRSLLLDSKADILVYGMAEKAIETIAHRIEHKQSLDKIRGTVISKSIKDFNTSDNDIVTLPSYEEILTDKQKFNESIVKLELEQNPYNARTVLQLHGKQYVIAYPPAFPLSKEDLDYIYDLPFKKEPHPSYSEKIPAYEMIKTSITALRGCPGGCSFCSIGFHQGKLIQSRSKESIISEIQKLSKKNDFTGTISDIGGPSANAYGLECKNKDKQNACKRVSCLYPEICKNLKTSSSSYTSLLKKVQDLPIIKKVYISSGIRYDLALLNPDFIYNLAKHNVSGLLKVAPEHCDKHVLKLMRKPPFTKYEEFVKIFYKISSEVNKKQFVLPYLISSFPGCDLEAMKTLGNYLKRNNTKVEQIQDFIPLPMTYASALYYTETDPKTNEPIIVHKKTKEREKQRNQLLWWKKQRKY